MTSLCTRALFRDILGPLERMILMRVKFNGIKKQARKSGCSSCGRRMATYAFEREKVFFFPTGAKQLFVAGEVYEVNDADGLFLLEQGYDQNGQKTYMFEQVK